MLTLLALLSSLGSSTVSPAPLAVPTDRAPIRLWMNGDRRYRPGDRVKLQVDADVDGFLLVLNYDSDGRVRVLFPVDPRDDARVRAGRRYEVRDGNGQEAFRASGDGTGLIFTAISQDPWRFDDVVLADRWDYSRLEIDRRSDNPEPELTDLVQRMAGPNGFDYDVLGYRVYGETTTSSSYNTYVYPGGPTYVYDDYLFCNNWSWRYNGCRRWPYDGGWSFGFGSYSPYSYGYGYRPYGYGYGYGFPYGGGYYPGRTYNRGPILAGRPRGYAVLPRTPVARSLGGGGGSYGSGVRSPVREVTLPPIDWRSRARPSNVSGRAPDGFVRGSQGGTYSAPPARRANGGDGYQPRSRDEGRREPSFDGGRSAPPPRSEPSRGNPPAAEPAPRSTGSSGGGGGGHPSAPSRPRRP